MQRNEELTGVFGAERHVFGDDDPERRTVIGGLEDGTTVRGIAAAGCLETGLTYRFLGQWTNHPRFGRQFAFSSFALARPAGRRAIIRYLTTAPHLGPVRAAEIYDRCGEESVETCRTHPEFLVADIAGISPEKAHDIAVYFNGIARTERLTIELTDLLAGRGFPRTLADKLIRQWGERAPQIVREDPYRLMVFRGVGFGTADALYLELGHDPAAIRRQAYCIEHAMASSGEGHTWWPVRAAQQVLSASIASARIDLPAAIQYGVDNKLLATREHGWLAERSKALAEERLAGHLSRVLRESECVAARWPLADEIPDVTDHQREQFARATAGLFGVLAGSPGTGKTYTLARIISAIQRQEGSARIAVGAPTGKAAVRASESLAANGVGIVATTIHRLLGVMSAGESDGDRETGWRFVHDQDNPLALDYLFVDEASMVDTSLAVSLLAARPQGCHVLWIGDPDQLSPVGHGAPLRDVIAAGLPCGHLKEIHRNAGRIVRTCGEIRDRHRCTFSPRLDLNGEPPENLVLLEATEPDGQIAMLESVLAGRTIGLGGLDRVWDVQIVVPVNDMSPLARKTLNRHLQERLNADGEQIPGCPFRVGDKLTCTKNGTLPLLAGDPNGSPRQGEAYCANGELARVVELAERYMVLSLSSPDRTVRVPRGRARESENGEARAACDFDLAYALSVHKSQGSDWPVVIVLLDGYGGALRVMDRHWIYTAISRAKRLCLCIGTQKTVDTAVRQSHMWRRKTFLREDLDAARLDQQLEQWALAACPT